MRFSGALISPTGHWGLPVSLPLHAALSTTSSMPHPAQLCYSGAHRSLSNPSSEACHVSTTALDWSQHDPHPTTQKTPVGHRGLLATVFQHRALLCVCSEFCLLHFSRPKQGPRELRRTLRKHRCCSHQSSKPRLGG